MIGTLSSSFPCLLWGGSRGAGHCLKRKMEGSKLTYIKAGFGAHTFAHRTCSAHNISCEGRGFYTAFSSPRNWSTER